VRGDDAGVFEGFEEAQLAHRVAPVLVAAGHRVVCPDLRGSPRPSAA
jgi:hypothetical protein